MNEDQWDDWVAALPEAVREVALRFPMTSCVRMRDNHGHYRVIAYANPKHTPEMLIAGLPPGPVLMTLAHGRDSYLPGLGVFGITADELELCGCGKWQPPTRAQMDATQSYVKAISPYANRQRDRS
jgi:hypothetical protein